MDDRFRFTPPLPFEASLAWNQMQSPENPLQNSPMLYSFPHPINDHLPLKGQSSYFKTRMCVRFKSGRCPNGDSCNFAHSSEELRRPLSNGAANIAFSHRQIPETSTGYVWINQSEEQKLYKKKVCRKFYTGGVCPYGDRCSFLHVDSSGEHNASSSSSRQTFANWKTKLCHRWSTGNCPYGGQCNHAHGDAELRKVRLEDCEVATATAPSKVSPISSDDVSPQPISEHPSRSRITSLTLEKCNRIYGDWIDD